MRRGRYDCNVSLKYANNLMFFERRDCDDMFRIIKIDTTNNENTTPSDEFYENFDLEGIKSVPQNELKDQKFSKETNEQLKFAFKCIRTPVSSRTFVIGGTENRTIRYLTLDETGKPKISPFYCKYTVDVIKKFDLFYKTNTLFRLRTGNFP